MSAELPICVLDNGGHFGQSARVQPSGAKVVVSRSTSGSRDRLRRYTVLVDGVEVGIIKRGEAVSTTVAPGPHTLGIVIDWTSSEVTFNADDGGAFHFVCSPAGRARDGLRDLAAGAQWVLITEGESP